MKDGAHGVADGAAQEGAATGGTDDQTVGAEGGAVAHEEADVFRVGDAFDHGK